MWEGSLCYNERYFDVDLWGQLCFGTFVFGSDMFGIPHGTKSLHMITRYHYIDVKLLRHLSVDVSAAGLIQRN